MTLSEEKQKQLTELKQMIESLAEIEDCIGNGDMTIAEARTALKVQMADMLIVEDGR
ncbi:hypothetical protein HDIA_0738 [Hartmannibacter diazotrophicus]|uniref:Uncharacterized protein n=1 Tax=Hartmannibacter diazotrophicus TaxID=1482074 RepID=A0A2C9D291_9HYPH|nr:hypothetical protein [Hartmannibacter diazotrophicus]SON54279.1 hypothetical protein HDIA_0738 [Hartmannibacter diazotrophicus]